MKYAEVRAAKRMGYGDGTFGLELSSDWTELRGMALQKGDRYTGGRRARNMKNALPLQQSTGLVQLHSSTEYQTTILLKKANRPTN